MSDIIQVPYNFIPRDYQLRLFQAMDGVEGKPKTKKDRALLRWHRRAGKDKACFAYMAKEMARKVGVYYYFFPTYSQGKKALWETIDKDGFKVLEHLPTQLIANKNKNDMLIELTNGSIFRIIGTDNIDSIVGSNPCGCVFSEYALQEPSAWTFISPILAENKGWAIFNSTPRGRNHMYKLEGMAKRRDNWYVDKLDVDDSGLYESLKTKIEEDRELHGDDFVDQEYYVQYSAGVKGAFYMEAVEKARNEGRIGTYPADDHKWIDTFWDIGVSDDTVCWFRQIDGGRRIFVDYMEGNGKDIAYWVKELENRGYKYRTHYLPHDGANRTWQTTFRTHELFATLCKEANISDDVVVLDKMGLQEGLNAVRASFSQYYFNEGLTELALEKLALYHRRYDRRREVFLKDPVHDWTSHCADALRTEAMAEDCEDSTNPGYYPKVEVINNYDAFGDYI